MKIVFPECLYRGSIISVSIPDQNRFGNDSFGNCGRLMLIRIDFQEWNLSRKTGIIRELSIIVPVLNEALILPELFRSLGEQLEVNLELLLCDGGSSDGTVELAEVLRKEFPFPARMVTSEPGRWRQMNCGAAAAEADILLFLHADSLFTDPLALRRGLDAIARAIAEKGDERVAGHFGLRFRSKGGNTSSAEYYHLECKARLNRRECTHGDQGMLLRRAFFEEVGPFDSTFPILAETRMAET